MTSNFTQLGNIITTKKGFAFKSQKYVKQGIPIVRVSDFTSNSISLNDLKYYPYETKETYKDFELKEKDIIIQTVGSWPSNPESVVGKVVRVPDSLDGALLNQNAVKIIPNKNISKIFLYYRLKTKDFSNHVIGEARGAANQASITLETIKSFKFSLPKIDNQKKIADILSNYDDLIENNKKQIKLLEEATEKLYKEWFIKLNYPNHEDEEIIDGIPKGWQKEKLINLVDVQYGFAFDGSKFNNEKKGNPIIRIRNIPTGETADYTTEEAPDNYIIHNGDILVGMDGEFHINTWNQQDAYLVQRACSFRPHKEFMKGYIFEAIKRPIKFFEKTLVGSTVSHLGKKHIDSIEIITGPDELYIPFDNLYKKRQILQNQIQLLQEARDKLLPKLMNGDIEFYEYK